MAITKTIAQKRASIQTKRNPLKSSGKTVQRNAPPSKKPSIHDIFAILLNNPIDGLPPDASETKLRS